MSKNLISRYSKDVRKTILAGIGTC